MAIQPTTKTAIDEITSGFLVPALLAGGDTRTALAAAVSAAMFNPLDLETKLCAWWSAKRADLITLSGSAVTSWADVVGGYALTQGTSANRPTYSATAVNGRPGITFDGTNDYLESSDAGLMGAVPTGAEAGEIWVICRNDADASDGLTRRAVAYGGNSNNTSRSARRTVISGADRLQGSVGTGAAAADRNQNLADFSERRVIRIKANGTDLQAYADGQLDLASAVAAVPSTDTTRFRAGAATNDTPAGYWKGVIEDIFITTLLTDREAAKLLAYCINQCGKDSDGAPDEIWLDGDSYSVISSNGDGMEPRFTADGRLITVSGVGGSTLAAQRARIEARLWSTYQTLIHWDGNPNGYASLADDMAHYAAIVAACPRSIIIPPVRRGADSTDMREYISTLQAALLEAYPTRTIDAQSLLAAAATSPGDDDDVAANVVPRSLLVDHVSDAHLNTAGWDVIYPAVKALVDSLVW